MDQITSAAPARGSGQWTSVATPILQVLFGRAGVWECEAVVAPDRKLFLGYIHYPPPKTPVQLKPGVVEFMQQLGLQPPKLGEWFWYVRMLPSLSHDSGLKLHSR